MSTTVYLITLTALFGTILLIFGMKFAAVAFASRARIASDTAYRSLAEKAVAVQCANETALTAIRIEISSVAARVAAVEKILKQVE